MAGMGDSHSSNSRYIPPIAYALICTAALRTIRGTAELIPSFDTSRLKFSFREKYTWLQPSSISLGARKGSNAWIRE